MSGANYVAVVALYDKHGKLLAAPGSTCESVPEVSLGWLEQDGLIKPTGSQPVDHIESPEPARPPRVPRRTRKE